MFKVFCVILILSLNSWSAETDGFTDRYQPVPDAMPVINQEIQNRIEKVLLKMNQKSNVCEWDQLNSELGSQLRRPINGEIESFIMNSPLVPKSPIVFDNSIFKNVPAIYNLPLRLGMMIGIHMGAPIHHKGYLIGADKFGHFMDEGYYYYSLVHFWNLTLNDVLKLGDFSETTYNGKWTGGIYSYADLSANYDGYFFWKDILGTPQDRHQSKYFDCEKGLWRLKKPIDLADYVSPAWDEGMNCNDFRTEGMAQGIDVTIVELEQKNHKRYHCPVFPEKVSEMIVRYADQSSWVIQPKILEQIKNK